MAEDPFLEAESGKYTADGQLIEEQVRTRNAPGAPNTGTAPTPGIVSTLRADLTKEYVSSDPQQWYANLAKVLPFVVDDLTSEWGADLYYRMLYDAIVSNCVVTLKADVIEDGLNLRPAVTDRSKDGYDDAQRILSDAIEMLDEYAGGNLDDWLWEAGDAIWRGHTVTEVKYRTDRTPSGRMQYYLDRLAVKPLHTFGFVVDAFKHVVAIAGLIPGVGMPVNAGALVMDPDKMPNFLPREKFAIYTHRPRDEDPRGTSICRPGYTAWALKMQTLPEYAKWLKQFASPTLLGFTPEDAFSIPLVGTDGLPLAGSNGAPAATQLTPEQAMLDTLTKVASGSAAVFPGGTKVEPIEMHGMGNPFLLAFRWFDEQISISIMGQSMTTMPQKIGTQALGNIQQDTQHVLVHQIKAGMCRMIFQDILRRWVRYNYRDKKYERLTPKPNLGQIEEPNLKEVLSGWSAAGWQLDPSQYAEVDRRIGITPRADNVSNVVDPAKPGARPAAPIPIPQPVGATMAQLSRQQQYDYRRRSERVQQLIEEERSKHWHQAVHIADEAYQRFGIRLDPALPPPNMQQVKQLVGVE